MKTGIVVLNYNTAQLTIDLVQKCLSMNAINEIVVVDNCSPDGSGRVLEKELGNSVTILHSDKNCGYAQGNNLGLKYLVEEKSVDYCFVSNPDVSFNENVIVQIIKGFEQNPSYGVLTCARIMENGNEIVQYWNIPQMRELILENFFIYYKIIKPHLEIRRIDKNDQIITIDVAPGSLFAIRSVLLKQIEYLDPNTFLYFEENCLSMKVKHTKYLVGYISSVSYKCLDRSSNSTAALHNASIFGRKCHCDSKNYFASKYLNATKTQSFLLHVTNKFFIFEKKVNILVNQCFGKLNQINKGRNKQ